MYLERRDYCYSYADCEESRTRINVIIVVANCISLLSILFSIYRSNKEKKRRQACQNSSIPDNLTPNNANCQPEPEELDPNWLPLYSSLQGTVINQSMPQYYTSPNYQVSPPPASNVNNNQSNQEYFIGGFSAAQKNIQLINNQLSYPHTNDVSNLNPLSNDHLTTLNNSKTIQYLAPAQPTIGQTHVKSSNANTKAQRLKLICETIEYFVPAQPTLGQTHVKSSNTNTKAQQRKLIRKTIQYLAPAQPIIGQTHVKSSNTNTNAQQGKLICEAIQYLAPAQPTIGQTHVESSNTNTNAQQGKLIRETIQCPVPAQPTLSQTHVESSNTNTNAQQGQTEQVQSTTATANNTSSN